MIDVVGAEFRLNAGYVRSPVAQHADIREFEPAFDLDLNPLSKQLQLL
jgi:hypothetical protein